MRRANLPLVYHAEISPVAARAFRTSDAQHRTALRRGIRGGGKEMRAPGTQDSVAHPHPARPATQVERWPRAILRKIARHAMCITHNP